MKKNFLRILCLVLVFAMLFAFAGCNKDETPDTPPPSDTTENGDNGGEGGSEGEGGEELPPEEPDPFEGLGKKEVQALHMVNFITFNIAFYDADDSQLDVQYKGQTASDYTIAKRQQRVKTLVEHYAPDVLALQEVNYKWWPYLITQEDSLLNRNNYEFCGNKSGYGSKDGRGAAPTELYNLLFWNTEKFEAVETGHFYLTKTGRSSGTHNANLARMCTWAILKNKITGNETLYASTHLCTTGDESLAGTNLMEAKYLIQHLTEAAGGRPIVVGGDFNMQENGGYADGTFKYITGEGGFTDTKRKAKTKLNVLMASYRFWGGTSNWGSSGAQIDHIFYQGDLQPIKWMVLPDTIKPDGTIQTGTTNVGKNYDISDHLPIYLEIREALPEAFR
jgi:endonuclease/exonuclease/phosphatase family metal-dependent hydrolase